MIHSLRRYSWDSVNNGREGARLAKKTDRPTGRLCGSAVRSIPCLRPTESGAHTGRRGICRQALSLMLPLPFHMPAISAF